MGNSSRALVVLGMILIASQFSLAQGGASAEAERARQILDKGLAENNPEARKEAVIALSLEGSTEETFSHLDIALNDKDVNVRMAACAGLATLKDNRSIPLLEK